MRIPDLFQYESETNQKILYANALLELAAQQDQKSYKDALISSCIIQLLAAYYALLEESQRRLNLMPQPGLGAGEILAVMQEKGVYSAMIEKLAKLERDKTSWLSSLRNRYRELSRSPSMRDTPIINDQISGDDKKIKEDNYGEWLAELERLCDDLRESLTEY